MYEAGSLTAVGYRNGAAVKTVALAAAGAPSRIRLDAYKDTVKMGDAAIINVSVTDADGNIVPTADNMISFEVDGGTFMGTGNGNPGSHESDLIPLRRAFAGRCQLLVRASGGDTIEVRAESETLKDSVCRVKVI